MRFKAKRARKSLQVRNNFARIKGFDDGYFMYDVEYCVNIPDALFKNAITVKLTVYTVDPRAKFNMFRGAKTSADMVENILSARLVENNIVAFTKSRAILSVNLDISTGISNQIASKLQKNPREANKLMATQRVFRAVPVSSMLSGRVAAAPRLGVSKQNKNFTSQNQSLKLSALEAVIENGIDPASLGSGNFPLITSKDSMQGTAGKTKGASHAGGLAEKNAACRSILSYFQLGVHRPTEIIENPPYRGTPITVTDFFDEHVQHKYFKNSIKVPDPAKFKISKLYFVFEMINSQGTVIEQLVKAVNHGEQLSSYYTPKEPPLISGGRGGLGTILLNVKQVDPVAVAVDIYKKIINPIDPAADLSYRFFTTVKATVGTDSVALQDNTGNGSTTVYRAIAIGPGQHFSRRFSSYVAQAVKIPGASSLPSREMENISIFTTALRSKNAISISLVNVPDGSVAAYVTVRDISIGERKHRIVGNRPADRIKTMPGATDFTDVNVKHGHTYLYGCTVIYPNGREVQANNPVVHKFFENSEQKNFEISNSNASFESGTGRLAVAVDLKADFTSQGLNSVDKALRAAGIELKFEGELQDNKDKYQPLLAFEVLRENHTTGEIESFGIVPANTKFIDGPEARKKTNAKNLLIGHTYRYVFNLCARNPGTFFIQTLQKLKDLETNRDYQVNIFKFRNPFTVATGILPSTQEVYGISRASRIKSQNPLLQGKTGLSMYANIAVPGSTAGVVGLSAAKVDNDENMLSWTLEGSQKKIDHYIVLAELEGVKSILATVHSHFKSNMINFFDDELARIVGTTTYSIVPVFTDYSYGAETPGESVTRHREIHCWN